MENLTEQQIRQIVQDEITRAQTQASYGVSSIPFHKHTGVDAPQIDYANLIGTVPTTSPSGSTTQIQYNDAGSFAGSSLMTFVKTAGGALDLSASAGTTGVGGQANFRGGTGGSSGNGGSVLLVSGSSGGGNTNGGNISLSTGNGAGSGHSGQILIGGTISTSSNGGFVVIPNCAGTPTGVPDNNGGTFQSAFIFDTTNFKLYVYTSAGWKSVTLS